MSADYQTHGLSIADAARHLGISENAVRQRIKRGTVDAVKVDGVWSITLREAYLAVDQVSDHESGYQIDQELRPPADHEARWPGDYQPTSPPAVSDAARAQLDAIRDEWLQPLIDQLRETERTLGRTEAERDQARQELTAAQLERDALQAELEHLAQSKLAPAPVDAQEGPGRKDWRAWLRSIFVDEGQAT